MSENKAICGAEWKPSGDCEDCGVEGGCCLHCETKNECSFVCETKEKMDFLRQSTIEQLLDKLGERLAERELYPLEFAELSRRFKEEGRVVITNEEDHQINLMHTLLTCIFGNNSFDRYITIYKNIMDNPMGVSVDDIEII